MNKNVNIQKVINLYSEVGWKRIFSIIRFWDAPFFEVEKMVPKKGYIIDLGCGEGIFTNFLALSSGKRKILGFELDGKRVKQADRGLKNVNFKQGNVLKLRLPNCDTIVLFHLLHHLKSYKDQEKLIDNCFNAIEKRGRLIIVEVDVKLSFKYFISWLTDHFVVPILFEGKLFEKDIHFRNKNEWLELLEQKGFDCKTFSLEKGKPFTHVVFECTKKPKLVNQSRIIN